MWVVTPCSLPLAIQGPPVFVVYCHKDKAAAVGWERWGLDVMGTGLAGCLPHSISPGRLSVSVDGCVCSPPPSTALCSGKKKAHSGASVIYGKGEGGKWEHKHMACIGNGAQPAP